MPSDLNAYLYGASKNTTINPKNINKNALLIKAASPEMIL